MDYRGKIRDPVSRLKYGGEAMPKVSSADERCPFLMGDKLLVEEICQFREQMGRREEK